MIDKFEMLIALAREQHFGRAALACNVTQPTLSSAIRALEQQFGMPLVLRGSRYLGLTPEGERVLLRARTIVAEARAIRSDLQDMRRGVGGILRLGVIPTALATVTDLTQPFLRQHPQLRLSVRSMSSVAIAKALADFEIDAGISYALDDTGQPPIDGHETLPLYPETWAALMRQDEAPDQLGWADLPKLRLCLLVPSMQNRRLLEQSFAAHGLEINPMMESDSMMALAGHAGLSGAASIMPLRPAMFLAKLQGLTLRPLPDPPFGLAPMVALIVPPEGRRSLLIEDFVKQVRLIAKSNRVT